MRRVLAAIMVLLVLPTTLSASHTPRVYADLMVFREHTTHSIVYSDPGVYRLHEAAPQCIVAEATDRDSVADGDITHDFAQRTALLPEDALSPRIECASMHWWSSPLQQRVVAPRSPPPRGASNR